MGRRASSAFVNSYQVIIDSFLRGRLLLLTWRVGVGITDIIGGRAAVPVWGPERVPIVSALTLSLARPTHASGTTTTKSKGRKHDQSDCYQPADVQAQSDTS